MRNSSLHSPSFILLAALALGLAASQPSQAAQGHAIVVAANDGYGLQECLGESGECGQAVADAWCAAEGRSAALSFGKSETLTPTQPAGYVVTCGD